ncbi:MAG: hypothetical protein IPJ89_05500 [Candidatus Iainarchaeum archaeon]|uniref:Uncharacterized protein n=1 Tax=Candidatus Iainarchaeum sp. TaxID=3101447 RepID=A0A7T9I200_9ARCH|nr:MAG: hypothetical protein IPJ89_05500 [Candidatus Diapherotrites archaeon]
MDLFDLFAQTPSNSSTAASSQKDTDSPEEAEITPPAEPLEESPKSDSEAPFNASEGSFPLENGPESGFSRPLEEKTPRETVVMMVPGSLVFRGGSFHLSWLTSLARKVESLHANGKDIALVVGESPHSRIVGKTARQLGLPINEIEAHIASSSFLNAALVLRLLANAHPRVCEEMQDAVAALRNGEITIVMGGKESISAEARAATLAEKTNAKCILLTENEIPTNTLSHSKFAKMANEAAQENDASFIVDPFTSLILARGKIETVLLWGKHISQLPHAIEGDDFDGTRITSQKDALPELRVKKRFSKDEE